ncbi:MAG TPA: hypothetical protein PJ990_18955 [Saprospiraceae bacterium]|nr:hypothetical protein [Saprospiraceae bacterium]
MMKKSRDMDADFLDFIKLCKQHEVRYLVIGGFAVSVHGYPRYTKDLDISIEMSDKNAEKMLMVIDDFGFSVLGLEKNDFLQKDGIIQLGHEPIRIDILNDLDVVSFDSAWNNRKVVEYEGVEKESRSPSRYC